MKSRMSQAEESDSLAAIRYTGTWLAGNVIATERKHSTTLYPFAFPISSEEPAAERSCERAPAAARIGHAPAAESGGSAYRTVHRRSANGRRPHECAAVPCPRAAASETGREARLTGELDAASVGARHGALGEPVVRAAAERVASVLLGDVEHEQLARGQHVVFAIWNTRRVSLD